MQTLTNQLASDWIKSVRKNGNKSKAVFYFLAPCRKAYLQMSKGQTTYPLTDKQKVALGKQNVRELLAQDKLEFNFFQLCS